MSEAAAEAFEEFVDRAVTWAASICGGVKPLGSEHEFNPVRDAYQQWMSMQADAQAEAEEFSR